MVKSWKKAAIAHGHGGRGRMVEAIAPKYSTQSGSMIDIYPQGTDKDGVRNAEKAFLLHYGWSGRAGDHWVDDAEQQGETATVDAMEAVFTEKMKEKGLI